MKLDGLLTALLWPHRGPYTPPLRQHEGLPCAKPSSDWGLLLVELEGDEAIARSHELTKLRGVKKALLWPYVGLIIALRAVSLGKSPILGALPTHVVKDVPEIPFAIYCSILFLSVLLSR